MARVPNDRAMTSMPIERECLITPIMVVCALDATRTGRRYDHHAPGETRHGMLETGISLSDRQPAREGSLIPNGPLFCVDRLRVDC